MVNDIVTNDIAGFVRAHLSESGKFGMRLFEAVNSADVYWIIKEVEKRATTVRESIVIFTDCPFISGEIVSYQSRKECWKNPNLESASDVTFGGRPIYIHEYGL
ncbi:hypothetical protein J4458_03395 [Candidatus Woesearchaeota archaeon]|nr:hypothetical protein [Candidatus Woesearchaeota archaeon]